jgi:putative transposase
VPLLLYVLGVARLGTCSLSIGSASARRPRPQLAVFDFIEDWYDPHRRHSSLDYAPPIEYERKNAA